MNSNDIAISIIATAICLCIVGVAWARAWRDRGMEWDEDDE